MIVFQALLRFLLRLVFAHKLRANCTFSNKPKVLTFICPETMPCLLLIMTKELRSIRDAWRRHLRPDAIVVPARARVLAVLVEGGDDGERCDVALGAPRAGSGGRQPANHRRQTRREADPRTIGSINRTREASRFCFTRIPCLTKAAESNPRKIRQTNDARSSISEGVSVPSWAPQWC